MENHLIGKLLPFIIATISSTLIANGHAGLGILISIISISIVIGIGKMANDDRE